jgi:hypothetical protein
MNTAFKTSIKIALTSIALTSALAACSPPADVKTGGSNSVAASAPAAENKAAENKDESGKKFTAGVSTEVLGVKINVADVSIKGTEVNVGLNYEATKPVHWYPDQEAKLQIGDMQLDVNMLMNTGLNNGDIGAGVKSDGVLQFMPPGGKTIDINKVKELKLYLGEIVSEDFMSTKKVEITIPVK